MAPELVLPAPPAPVPVLELELELVPGSHPGGSVVLPMQSSQGSQLFRHAFTGRQGWHFAGSLISASVHEPLPFASSDPSHT